jgi:hypothetical protein
MTARATPAGASVTRPGRSGPAGAWERAVGAFYDPFLFVGERLGMAARQRQLLVQARGEVLEIGAGTGLKLGHYPPELSGLVLTEPNEPRRGNWSDAPHGRHSRRRVIRADARSLPFPARPSASYAACCAPAAACCSAST